MATIKNLLSNMIDRINDNSDEVNLLSEEIVDLSVTPQMFGAKADGVTDDTQAINDALATGNKVFFPTGTYKVTSSLILPSGVCISGVSGLSTIKTYITDGYVLKSATDNVITSANIESIKFENGNTQNSTTKLVSGNFVYSANNLYMRNCRIYKYYNVFYQLYSNSYILNCRFNTIYNCFTDIVTDSVINGCYINASRLAFPYKSQCFGTSFNSTTLTNCLIDYFYSIFAVKTSASGTVMGNTFNRSVNVFHDHIQKMTITNNIFTGIQSASVDLTVLTAEQIASLEAEKWSVIKFDNKQYSATHTLNVVTFSNNMGFDCEYYFYVADGVEVVPSDCEFRGNQISAGAGNELSAVEVGFRNTTSTESAYNSMHNVFFDFWDMKEYDELPSPALYNNNAKSIFTFPYMRAVHNGDIYTNINGEWVKGGGEVELPDLSVYAKKNELNGYVTDVELDNEITLLKAQGIQQTPLFANSVDECTDNAKVYVLPDGYIYGYMKKTEEVETGTRPNFTNLKSQATFKYKERYSLSSATFKTSAYTAIIVPVPTGKTTLTLRLKGCERASSYPEVYGGTSATAFTADVGRMVAPATDGVTTVTITKNSDMSYIIFNIIGTTASDFTDVIVTIDEPIEYVTGTETIVTEGFDRTVHKFVPADYEARIIALENKIAELEAKS